MRFTMFDKYNRLVAIRRFAAFFAALCFAFAFVAGCESADDCMNFAKSDRLPSVKGCVPPDFDPDKVDYTASCEYDGLTICYASYPCECNGRVCKDGEWRVEYLAMDVGCGYAACHLRTSASMVVQGDEECYVQLYEGREEKYVCMNP